MSSDATLTCPKNETTVVGRPPRVAVVAALVAPALLVVLGLATGCGREASATQPMNDDRTAAPAASPAEREAELAERRAHVPEILPASVREPVRSSPAVALLPPAAPSDATRAPAGLDPGVEHDGRLEPRHFPRPVDPRPAEPASLARVVSLPAGTELDVRLIDGVSSDESHEGDPVRALVATDVVRDGALAIPAGAQLSGRVVDISAARRIGGRSRIVLAFDRLELGGEAHALTAGLVAEGKPQSGKDAATIGGATAGGAVLGRVLGHDEAKGTLIGAVVGAAVGSAVASRNAADPVLLESGSVVTIVLESSLELVLGGPTPKAPRIDS